MVKCRLKLEIDSMIWNKHGDHPQVSTVPDHYKNQVHGPVDTFGCVQIGNEVKIFGPGTRIITTGGRTFPVDAQYYNEYYEELTENESKSD